jgi:hypothetical protein
MEGTSLAYLLEKCSGRVPEAVPARAPGQGGPAQVECEGLYYVLHSYLWACLSSPRPTDSKVLSARDLGHSLGHKLAVIAEVGCMNFGKSPPQRVVKYVFLRLWPQLFPCEEGSIKLQF